MTSLPSSPLPSNITRVAEGGSGVPIRILRQYFRWQTRARAANPGPELISERGRAPSGNTVDRCFGMKNGAHNPASRLRGRSVDSACGGATMTGQSEYLCYTDGSCKAGDGSPGGWGFVIKRAGSLLIEAYGKEHGTLAKIMEYRAVAEALAALPADAK